MTWQEHAAFAETTTAFNRIESQVLNKIGSRLSEFSLDVVGDHLVLRGKATSYHVKQLVQQEVMGLTNQPILANQIVVYN